MRFTESQLTQLRIFLNIGKRIEACSDDLKTELVTALEILNDQNESHDEKQMAFQVLASAVFPPEVTAPLEFEPGETK